MRAIPVKQAGWIVADFVPLDKLRPPPDEGGSGVAGGEDLPFSATEQGWPEWVAGIHSDDMPYWYHLWNDAGPGGKPCARYARQYPPPQPPDPPPTKPNNDGNWLYAPCENQQQGTCIFEEVPYD